MTLRLHRYHRARRPSGWHGSRTTREVRQAGHRKRDAPQIGPLGLLRTSIGVRQGGSDSGYVDLQRALRDLGTQLLLRFTADLVPRVVQRIVAGRQRPADRD